MRKHPILGSIALALICLLVTLGSSAATNNKPNILMILADDLAWNDAGCYGNPEVNTPHIDHLATEGLRFTQAFTATAMCAPTRQQLYTGIFPVRNGAYPNHSQVKPETRSMVHHLRDLGYRVGIKGKEHFGPEAAFPFDRVSDDFAYMSIDSEPFCLIFASDYPHPAWPQISKYDPAQITVPEFMVDNEETRQALCRYYTAVTAFDTEVGELLNALKRSGKKENTVVIVTSEQGPDFPFGKWTCYDYGLRTQFIVRWPGEIKPGRTTDAMIQYVDVLPTIIELAGADPTSIDTGLPGDPEGGTGFDGKSFLKVLKGETDRHGDVVYGVHTTYGIIAGKPYPVRSVRDHHYKYILNPLSDEKFENIVTEKNYENYWNSWVRDAEGSEQAARLVHRYQFRPEEEFYDVVNDPFEQRNLAKRPEFREKMDQMKKQLIEWMTQQSDRGIETEKLAQTRKIQH